MHKKAGKPDHKYKIQKIHDRMVCFEFIHRFSFLYLQKQKTVAIKISPRQFFRVITFCKAKQTKPCMLLFLQSFAVPAKPLLLYREVCAKQHQSRSSDSQHKKNTLPSRFPNDRLSPTDIILMHTATGIAVGSHHVPFSPNIPCKKAFTA